MLQAEDAEVECGIPAEQRKSARGHRHASNAPGRRPTQRRFARERHVPMNRGLVADDLVGRQPAFPSELGDVRLRGLHEAARQRVVVVVQRGEHEVRTAIHQGLEPAEPFPPGRGAGAILLQPHPAGAASQLLQALLRPPVQIRIHHQHPREVPVGLRQHTRQAGRFQQFQAEVDVARPQGVHGAEPGAVHVLQPPAAAHAEPRDDEVGYTHRRPPGAPPDEPAPGSNRRATWPRGKRPGLRNLGTGGRLGSRRIDMIWQARNTSRTALPRQRGGIA